MVWFKMEVQQQGRVNCGLLGDEKKRKEKKADPTTEAVTHEGEN